MVKKTPGAVTERILLLGREESCVYLLQGGDEYALVGGGMAYIIPDVLDQLRDFSVDEKKVRRVVILHSHFDHCGAAPYFKERWPWARITASRRAKELLSTPRVAETIASMNRAIAAANGREKRLGELGFEFGGLTIDEVVNEGDELALGDLTMRVLEVPGHSSCSIAVYVPGLKALFASDAGGIPFGNTVFTAANSNFDQYQQSLEKMSRCDVEVHCAEHYGAYTGEEGRSFMKRSIESARETRAMLEESYRRWGDLKRSVEEITSLVVESAPDYFLPREVIAMVVGQMMGFIEKKMSPKKG
jgi:glyoxylase-like metal-dependent hydrolase (beta-lactamase superfamily II)